MSSSRITIKDIARHLGVHHATVSRALRGDVRISASMRQLVTDYAQKQGYAVNQNALNLRNMSRNEIALVVPNISHYTFSYFIGKMSDLANNAGYVVSVFQSKERAEIEKQIIDTLIKNRVAGVIASISKSTLDGIAFQKLIDFGIPLVFFDRVCSDVEVPTVTTDNFSAALTGVRYLFQKGYRRIAHITGPAHVNVFRDRQLGYRHGLRECGLDYSGEIVFAQEFHLTDGQKALDQLLANATKPMPFLRFLCAIGRCCREVQSIVDKYSGRFGRFVHCQRPVQRPNRSAANHSRAAARCHWPIGFRFVDQGHRHQGYSLQRALYSSHPLN
jgi:DNA-binding LacI/PurR family transcriptional regulator